MLLALNTQFQEESIQLVLPHLFTRADKTLHSCVLFIAGEVFTREILTVVDKGEKNMEAREKLI